MMPHFKISVLFVALVICSHCSMAQFTRTLIRQTADARVKQLLGEALFAHCYNSYDIRYTYTDDSGKIKAVRLTETDTIVKGRVDLVYVNYVFSYEFPELKDTNIYGEFNIVLDKWLQTVRQPDFGFIPEYLYHIKDNGFLARTQIVKIAKDSGLDSHKPGIEYSWGIEHLKGIDKFVYVLRGRPEKFDLRSQEYEVMIIDAFSGVVMYHLFGDEARETEHKLRGQKGEEYYPPKK